MENPNKQLPPEMAQMEAFQMSERDQKIIAKCRKVVDKAPDDAVARMQRYNIIVVLDNPGIPAAQKVSFAANVISQLAVELVDPD